jgi:processive 1,2-diacylglycerol beta-glucosyltransferase
MPEHSTLLILHCPAGGGHRAAAEALAERAAARGVRAQVLDALAWAPAWFARLYVQTHLEASARVPQLYGGAYFATNHRSSWGPVEALGQPVERWLGGTMVGDLARLRPTAIIATHFFPIRNLLRAREAGRLQAPLIEVVTDYAAHAVWAQPGLAAYCAAPGRACADLVRHGIDARSVRPTGIPVRDGFLQARTRTPGTQHGPLRVLITSGGFGVGPVARVVRSFAGTRGIELTVVCGNNPQQERHVRQLCRALGLRAEVLGFERDMPARMAAADLVVSKPGGLTVSECAAAGRPMLFVGGVPGQETLNQQFVIERGAGLASCADEVASAATMLNRNRERLIAMSRQARTLATDHAADAVIDVALAAHARPRQLCASG